MKFGCIGLGRIGGAVAAHLAAGGHEVVAYDIRPEKQAEVERLGIAWSPDLAGLAARVDAVVNCVLTAADVQAVLGGERGVLAGARPGLVFIEMTTLSPDETIANAALLGARGVRYLDCPVSGGADGAARGELVLIAGGDAATIDALRPELACIARRFLHMGEVGAGSRMKTIVQSIFLSQMAAFLEALALGRAAGLPIARQLEVLAETTAHHPTLGKRYRQIVEEDYAPRFEIGSALKDLAIVRELAQQVGFSAEVAECCYERYREASEAGHTNEDLIALLRLAN